MLPFLYINGAHLLQSDLLLLHHRRGARGRGGRQEPGLITRGLPRAGGDVADRGAAQRPRGDLEGRQRISECRQGGGRAPCGGVRNTRQRRDPDEGNAKISADDDDNDDDNDANDNDDDDDDDDIFTIIEET
jgi:hypothetical protein